MKKVRRILVPTDFSNNSREAFEMARSLAEKFGATLGIAHVMPHICYDTYGGFSVTVPVSVEADIEAGVDQRLAVLKEELSGDGDVEVHKRRGNPASELITLAEEAKFDMIVMGTHGHSGIKRWILGSTAESVIRGATCPVTIVPTAAKESSCE